MCFAAPRVRRLGDMSNFVKPSTRIHHSESANNRRIRLGLASATVRSVGLARSRRYSPVGLPPQKFSSAALALADRAWNALFASKIPYKSAFRCEDALFATKFCKILEGSLLRLRGQKEHTRI